MFFFSTNFFGVPTFESLPRLECPDFSIFQNFAPTRMPRLFPFLKSLPRLFFSKNLYKMFGDKEELLPGAAASAKEDLIRMKIYKKAEKRSKHGRDFSKRIKTHKSCAKFFETKFWIYLYECNFWRLQVLALQSSEYRCKFLWGIFSSISKIDALTFESLPRLECPDFWKICPDSGQN